MKKSIISGIIALILTLSVTACSDTTDSNSNTNDIQTDNTSENNNSDTPQLEKTDFNIGYLNSTAHLLAFVAKEEAIFHTSIISKGSRYTAAPNFRACIKQTLNHPFGEN